MLWRTVISIILLCLAVVLFVLLAILLVKAHHLRQMRESILYLLELEEEDEDG